MIHVNWDTYRCFSCDWVPLAGVTSDEILAHMQSHYKQSGSVSVFGRRSERVTWQERSAEENTLKPLPSHSSEPVPQTVEPREDSDLVVMARISLLSYHSKRGLLFPGMDERNKELHELIDALIEAVRLSVLSSEQEQDKSTIWERIAPRRS